MGWNFLERYMNFKKLLTFGLLLSVVHAAPPLPDPTGKQHQIISSNGTSWITGDPTIIIGSSATVGNIDDSSQTSRFSWTSGGTIVNSSLGTAAITIVAGSTNATFTGGILGTGATGGNQGAGTGNFTALYVNGVAVGTSTGNVSTTGSPVLTGIAYFSGATTDITSSTNATLTSTGELAVALTLEASGAIPANKTSATAIGFTGGNAQFYSFGANTSTGGGYAFASVSSNGSVNVAALTLAATNGNASFLGTISSQQATVRANSIGVTSTDGSVLQNLTVASLGAQQWSPRIHWIGQGWETSTSASQTVDFWAEAQPVQGSTNPSGNWVLSSRINGGGTTTLVTVTSAGTTSIAGGLTVTGGITSSGSGITNQLTNNGTQAIIGPTSSTPLFIVTGNTTAITISTSQVVSTSGQLTVGGAFAVPGGSLSIFQTNATMTNGAGAQVGTLTNSPVAGSPTTWFAINDNGTVRHVPAW